MKRLFIFNTLIKSSTLFFGFIISVFISNYFGSSSLGLYILFITLLNLFLIIVRGGQDRLLIKDLNDKKEDHNKILSEAFSLIFSLFLTTSLIVCILIWLNFIKVPFLISRQYFVMCLMVSLLAGGVISFVVVSLRAKEFVTRANVFEGLPVNVLLLLVLVSIVFFGLNDQGLIPVVVYTIVAFLVALALLLALKHQLQWKASFRKLDLLSRFRKGLPFMLIFGTTSLNTSIDTLMVSSFLTIDDVAYYNGALKLSSLIQFGLVISTSLIMGKMAAQFQNHQIKLLRSTIKQAILLSLSLAIPTSIIFLFASNEILSVWGQEFVIAKNPLFILMLAQLINVSFGPLGVMLTVLGKEKQVLYWSCFTLIFNIIGNYILVPWLGIQGAALSTAGAVIIENIIFFSIVRYYGLLRVSSFDESSTEAN